MAFLNLESSAGEAGAPAGRVPGEVADAGRALLRERTGCDPHDRSTWTHPVVRLGDPEHGASPVERSIGECLP